MSDTMNSKMMKTITIDFWNTIVDSSNGKERKAYRTAAITDAFRDTGIQYTEADIQKAFDLAHTVFDQSWRSRYRTLGASEILSIVWNEMDVRVPDEAHARIVKAFEESVLVSLPNALPGALEIIPQLAQQYSLAIISDTALSPGKYLRGVLEKHGLLGYFSNFVFSDEIGVSKPHIRAFETALQPIGCKPEEAVHIGDIERTDVTGAKNAGLHAILFRGDTASESFKCFAGETQADHIAESWYDVPGIVQLLSEKQYALEGNSVK